MCKNGILLASGSNEMEILEFYLDESRPGQTPYRGSYGINVAIVTEFNRVPMAFAVSGVNRIHRLAWGKIESPGEFLGTLDSCILKALPVILFSSLINDQQLHKGHSVGADEQISKSETAILSIRVRELIEQYMADSTAKF